MSVTLYAHPISPYCRSVHSLLIAANIDHNYKLIDLVKGEQFKEEYTKISATSNVPALGHGDFNLIESHSILRYVVKAFNKHEFYAQDIKGQAQIDSFLDWLQGAASIINGYEMDFTLGPLLMGKQAPDNRAERLKEVEYYLEFFERVFLNKGEYKFVNNHEGISISDFTAVANLTSLFAANFDFTKFPVLTKYLVTLLAIPSVKQTHVGYFEFVKGNIPTLNEFITQQMV